MREARSDPAFHPEWNYGQNSPSSAPPPPGQGHPSASPSPISLDGPPVFHTSCPSATRVKAVVYLESGHLFPTGYPCWRLLAVSSTPPATAAIPPATGRKHFSLKRVSQFCSLQAARILSQSPGVLSQGDKDRLQAALHRAERLLRQKHCQYL